jgi:hypothetical protein
MNNDLDELDTFDTALEMLVKSGRIRVVETDDGIEYELVIN